MLKLSEREKLHDCLLMVQSARNILAGMHAGTIPNLNDLLKCFQDADRTITLLLRT